jgi:PhoH-like ATPase
MPARRKTFVLDTSVLLSSPRALFAFDEHEVVVPLVVISELNGKKDDERLGQPAREALRLLEELRVQEDSNLQTGVPVGDQGGTVRIEINHVHRSGLPETLQVQKDNDTRILAVAKNLGTDPVRSSAAGEVVLVSKDVAMRLLAESVGVTAQEYRHEQVYVSNQYTGVVTVDDASADTVSALYADGHVSFDALDIEVPERNTGVILPGALATVGVIPATGEKGLLAIRPDLDAYGIHGRSAEQRLAVAHLLNPDIGIVSLGGNAGTGKSLLALAAALEIVLNGKAQKNIVVFRPLFAVGGQDLGYLPGSENDKMAPWGGAVFDALKEIDAKGEAMRHLQERDAFEVLPLTHIRGRSLNDTIVIVDEAQNLERQVLMSVLSRLGRNSRVFLTHDVAQRDNLRVGRHDGIAAVVEILKGHPLFAHITLTRSERSPIAALVADLLDDFA